jgi:uncharacterized membrane protein HdeD (DUF308 family)
MSWLSSPLWQALAGLCAWSALVIAVCQVRSTLGWRGVHYRAIEGIATLLNVTYFTLVLCIVITILALCTGVLRLHLWAEKLTFLADPDPTLFHCCR